MIIGKSLTALGGGGLKPEIRVTAKAGALLNLHFKNSSIILQSYQLGASETTHTFVVNVSETAYVVEDEINSGNVEILVDTVAIFNVRVSYQLTLYDSGNEYTSVTGGWKVKYDYDNGTGTLTKNSSDMTLTCYRQQSYGYGVIQVTTNNKIDFSYSTRMCIQFSNSNSSTRNIYIGYYSVNNASGINTVGSASSSGTLKSDIQVEGLYYPVIQYSNSTDVTSTETLTIYKIWLE